MKYAVILQDEFFSVADEFYEALELSGLDLYCSDLKAYGRITNPDFDTPYWCIVTDELAALIESVGGNCERVYDAECGLFDIVRG